MRPTIRSRLSLSASSSAVQSSVGERVGTAVKYDSYSLK